MKAIQIAPHVWWVGAKDWNVRDFHGYKTQRGTTYNAYLIIDEKITLVDTVKKDFFPEMLERIRSVVDPAKIDILVSNHVEMDHSGALPQLVPYCPNATVVTSPNGEIGLKKHYDTSKWNLKVVKTGDSLPIGKHTLRFVTIPFVHWPDSMATYLESSEILFPNDAFGQHIAPSSLFADENPLDIVLEEAQKYYANIVLPYGPQVEKALDAVGGLKVSMICPSHGAIWRQNLSVILDRYVQWSQQKPEERGLIVYDSMWQSTETMAKIVQGVFEVRGIPTLVRSLKHEHISDVMTHLLTARYVAIGTPTLNNGVLPTVEAFLHYMKGLRAKNKRGFIFGSYGWDNRPHKDIEAMLKGLEWEIPIAPQVFKWVPSGAELENFKAAVQNFLG